MISIGKIADIFAHVGISKKVKASGLDALWDATLQEFAQARDRSLVLANFVDFDTVYGHRRNVAGYAASLEAFDQRVPELLALLRDEDMLIITADHGCDPTWPGSDHTRECVPVLCYGKKVLPRSMGERASFADIGQTLARYFALSPMDYGTVFID